MSEPAATPNKHANHDRKDLAQYASAKFEKGFHLVHKSKFEMARNKFRSAQKARILLHDDVYHITIAPGYEILGHVNLALGDWEEAKLNLLAAQEICEKNLDLLGSDTGEKQDMKDLLGANIQRIKNWLEIVEVRQSDKSPDFVKSFDVTVVKSISNDMTKYSNLNLSRTLMRNNFIPLERNHEASKKPKKTAGSYEQDSVTEYNSLPCHDAPPANDDSGGDESNTINVLDDLHSSASTPAWLLQDDSAPVPFSILGDSQAEKKQSRIEALMVSDATFSHSSVHATNIPSHHANSIMNPDHLPTDQEFRINQIIQEQSEESKGAMNTTDLHSNDRDASHLNEPMNDSQSSSQLISATARRYMGEDEEIFIPEAIAIDRDEDIPHASVIVPEKNSLSLTVNGIRIPAIPLMIILLISLALLIGFLVNAAVKKSNPSTQGGKNETSITEIKTSIEGYVLQRNVTFHYMGQTDPRFLALDWILNTDKMQLELTDYNLYQRYILALLAFHFSSLEWTHCGNYLNSETCSVSERNGMGNAEKSLVWLSSADECEWYGVTCDENGRVVGLEVAENNWIGAIPPEISRLEYLQYLALPNNCLYGTLPPELGNMMQLKELNLSLNRLSGLIPDELYNLSTLVRIDFSSQNSWNETKCYMLSEGATGNPNYNYINLGLQGAVLENIWRLQDLRELFLYDNYCSGTISPEIENLKQLEILSVGLNIFSGTIPSAISKLNNLKELWLELNWLSGSLPQSIKVLSVHSMENITGTIPDSIYHLTNLKHLYLYGDHLEGSLKAEIGKLKSLTSLLISNNQFSGTLPSELGLCEKLGMLETGNLMHYLFPRNSLQVTPQLTTITLDLLHRRASI
ncbi:hypothetical protein HJC23_008889 [Cyclotella cryptica]|uniref:Leucine-rich repeat-containing N-terminal plant-type domain-containing protein n=1 Tax=Cyclotella cryptica TaxID=29204 RepID=A0ABD3NRN4_9STRA